MPTQALERIVPPTSEATAASETYFSAFLRALEHDLNPYPPVAQHGHSVLWQGIPATRMVADGLWPIMIKIAEKLDISLTTEQETTRVVSPVANRILTAGLFLRHGEPEAAAKACAEIIRLALSQTKAENTLAPHALWTRGIAQFFAHAVTHARQFSENLLTDASALVKGNTYTKKRHSSMRNEEVMVFVNLKDLAESVANIAACTSFKASVTLLEETPLPAIKEGVTPSLDYCRTFLQIPARLAERKLAHRVCMKLPCHLERLPGDAVGTEAWSTIEYGWLNTQILLAAVEAPYRDYLDSQEETETALKWLVQSGSQKVIEKTLTRLYARGLPTLTQEEQGWLSSRLVSLANNAISSWAEKSPVPERFQRNVLIQHDSAQALELARGDTTQESVTLATNSTDYWNEVVSRLNWPEMTVDTVVGIIEAKDMPFTHLEAGLAKLPVPIRLEAITKAAPELEKNAWARFDELGWIPNDPALIVTLQKKMPVSIFSTHFESILKHLEDRRDSHRTNLEIVFETVALMHGDPALERLGHTPLRESLAQILMSEMHGVLGTTWYVDLKRKPGFSDLQAAVGGEEAWRKIVLGAVALLREPEEIRKEIPRMPSWRTLATDPEGYNFETLLGLKETEAKRFLVKHSESGLLRWLREEPPKKSKKTATKKRAKPRRT